MIIPALAIAAVSPVAAVLAIGLIGSLMIAPILYQATKIAIWTQAANSDLSEYDITESIVEGATTTTLNPDIPQPPANAPPQPLIVGLSAVVNQNPGANPVTANVTLTIQTSNVAAQGAEILFLFGNQTFMVSNYTATPGGSAPGATETFSGIQVPQGVLLGASQIEVQTSDGNGGFVDTLPATIANQGGYEFTGDVRGIDGVPQLDVLGPVTVDPITGDPINPVDPDDQAIIDQIPLDGTPNAILVSPDLSRVFVATSNGIDIIDGFTFTYYGRISVGGDGNVTALALSADGNTLYAAVTGGIMAININPSNDPSTYTVGTPLPFPKTFINLATYMLGVNATGYISTIATNANGDLLFVGAPGSQLIGDRSGDTTTLNGGTTQSAIYVINIDTADIPAAGKPNTNEYQQVIATIPGGLDIYQIISTNDPTKMVFTSRGNLNSGFNTISITNANPTTFAYSLNAATGGTPLNLALDLTPIGTTYSGIPGPDGTQFGESLTGESERQYADLRPGHPQRVRCRDSAGPDLCFRGRLRPAAVLL